MLLPLLPLHGAVLYSYSRESVQSALDCRIQNAPPPLTPETAISASVRSASLDRPRIPPHSSARTACSPLLLARPAQALLLLRNYWLLGLFTKRYWSREKLWLLGLFTKCYWSREKRWLLGLFTKRYWSCEKRWLLGLFTKRYWSREKRWLLGLITKRYWSREKCWLFLRALLPRKNRWPPVVSRADSFRSAAGLLTRQQLP